MKRQNASCPAAKQSVLPPDLLARIPATAVTDQACYATPRPDEADPFNDLVAWARFSAANGCFDFFVTGLDQDGDMIGRACFNGQLFWGQVFRFYGMPGLQHYCDLHHHGKIRRDESFRPTRIGDLGRLKPAA